MDIKVKPIEKANQTLDIITNNGANLIGGISFMLSDEEQKRLEDKAFLLKKQKGSQPNFNPEKIVLR